VLTKILSSSSLSPASDLLALASKINELIDSTELTTGRMLHLLGTKRSLVHILLSIQRLSQPEICGSPSTFLHKLMHKFFWDSCVAVQQSSSKRIFLEKEELKACLAMFKKEPDKPYSYIFLVFIARLVHLSPLEINPKVDLQESPKFYKTLIKKFVKVFNETASTVSSTLEAYDSYKEEAYVYGPAYCTKTGIFSREDYENTVGSLKGDEKYNAAFLLPDIFIDMKFFKSSTDSHLPTKVSLLDLKMIVKHPNKMLPNGFLPLHYAVRTENLPLFLKLLGENDIEVCALAVDGTIWQEELDSSPCREIFCKILTHALFQRMMDGLSISGVEFRLRCIEFINNFQILPVSDDILFEPFHQVFSQNEEIKNVVEAIVRHFFETYREWKIINSEKMGHANFERTCTKLGFLNKLFRRLNLPFTIVLETVGTSTRDYAFHMKKDKKPWAGDYFEIPIHPSGAYFCGSLEYGIPTHGEVMMKHETGEKHYGKTVPSLLDLSVKSSFPDLKTETGILRGNWMQEVFFGVFECLWSPKVYTGTFENFKKEGHFLITENGMETPAFFQDDKEHGEFKTMLGEKGVLVQTYSAGILISTTWCVSPSKEDFKKFPMSFPTAYNGELDIKFGTSKKTQRALLKDGIFSGFVEEPVPALSYQEWLSQFKNLLTLAIKFFPKDSQSFFDLHLLNQSGKMVSGAEYKKRAQYETYYKAFYDQITPLFSLYEGNVNECLAILTSLFHDQLLDQIACQPKLCCPILSTSQDEGQSLYFLILDEFSQGSLTDQVQKKGWAGLKLQVTEFTSPCVVRPVVGVNSLNYLSLKFNKSFLNVLTHIKNMPPTEATDRKIQKQLSTQNFINFIDDILPYLDTLKSSSNRNTLDLFDPELIKAKSEYATEKKLPNMNKAQGHHRISRHFIQHFVITLYLAEPGKAMSLYAQLAATDVGNAVKPTMNALASFITNPDQLLCLQLIKVLQIFWQENIVIADVDFIKKLSGDPGPCYDNRFNSINSTLTQAKVHRVETLSKNMTRWLTLYATLLADIPEVKPYIRDDLPSIDTPGRFLEEQIIAPLITSFSQIGYPTAKPL
jgi:hypothetical protein